MVKRKYNTAFFKAVQEAGMVRRLSKSPEFKKQYLLFKKKNK